MKRSLIMVLLLMLVAVLAIGLCVYRPLFFPVVSASSLSIAPGNLRNHVRLLSEEYVPRTWDDVSGTRQTVSYIEKHFAASGGDVVLQSYEASKIPLVNIIAHFGKSTGPLVVVGAHYDAMQGTPGADDNASGVAGVLELATILHRFPLQNIRIELVAFGTEEPPHFNSDRMGSAHYVRSLLEARQRVRMAIILEMIGFYRDEPESQRYPFSFLSLVYPSVGNFIGVVGEMRLSSPTYFVKRHMQAAARLPVYSMNVPRMVPGIDSSDQRNFWDAELPAVMVTDTAYLRNPNYHEISDRWDTLNYSRMAEVVSGVYNTLKVLNEDISSHS